MSVIENDPYKIMIAFNQACGELAISLPEVLVDLDEMHSHEIEISINHAMIPDIDDFWGLIINDVDLGSTDFLTKMVRWLGNVIDTQHFFKAGIQKMSMNQAMKSEFDKEIATKTIEATYDFMRYLPHELTYLYPTLLKLDGFKKLNDLIMEMDGTSLAIKLDVDPRATNIHQAGAYYFNIEIESRDGQSIYSKAKAHKPIKLH